MKTLTLTDSDLFIATYNNGIGVWRYKGVHSPLVNYNVQNWEFVDSVHSGSDKYTSIEIFGRVIQDQELDKLAFDLEASQLVVNREGYCYYRHVIKSPSSGRSLTAHFDNIQYHRLNDLFTWSSYQVNPKYTFNWNRHDIYTNKVIIDTDTSKMKIDYETRIQILQAENNKKLNENLQRNNKNEMILQDKLKCLQEELKKLQDLDAKNKKKLESFEYENKNMHDLVNENEKLKGLQSENENNLHILRDEKKQLQATNEEEVKVWKQELQDLQQENKNLKENEMKMHDLVNENEKLKGLQSENENNLPILRDEKKQLQATNEEKVKVLKQELHDLQQEYKNLKENEMKMPDLQENSKIFKGNEKKMQSLQNEIDVLQRKLDDKSLSHVSSQPPSPPPPPPPPSKGRYSFQTDEYTSILRYFQPSKPDQFLFEIQCFTDLKKSIQDANYDEFESPEFEVVGQKWMLSIYLEGIPTEDTDGHISLYLKKQPDQITRVDNMKMLVRFFIYSHKYKEYLTIQELIVQNFDDQLDLKAGIPQALKITDFYNINNGFVYGGKCRFGIEVFNMTIHPQTFTLTSVKKLYHGGKCICKFNNYSNLPKEVPLYSNDEFKIEIISVKNRTVTYLWKVQIYPAGIEEDEDKNVSLFLELVSTENVSNGRQLFADFELRLKCHDNSTKYYAKRRVAWFTQIEYNHGFNDFIPIDEFDIDGKYINLDSITVEVYFHKMFRMEDV